MKFLLASFYSNYHFEKREEEEEKFEGVFEEIVEEVTGNEVFAEVRRISGARELIIAIFFKFNLAYTIFPSTKSDQKSKIIPS